MGWSGTTKKVQTKIVIFWDKLWWEIKPKTIHNYFLSWSVWIQCFTSRSKWSMDAEIIYYSILKKSSVRVCTINYITHFTWRFNSINFVSHVSCYMSSIKENIHYPEVFIIVRFRRERLYFVQTLYKLEFKLLVTSGDQKQESQNPTQ